MISSSAQVIGSLPSGVISGSSQIDASALTIDYFNLQNLPVTITPFQANSILANSAARDNFSANVKTELNNNSVVSSSAQITELLPDGVISGSSQLYTDLDARYGNEEGDNLVSGSAQVKSLLPSGVISGSAQLPSGTVSGSAQITDVVTNTYISASAAASGFGDVPSGTISSSAQIASLGYITSQTDEQTLSISGQTLTISNGNSVLLPQAGVGSGASIWNTGSQDPESYTSLMTQNNLQVTGSFDILGDFTVNGQSVFKQTSASDAGAAVVVEGRLKILEEQIGSYIASASIQIGNSNDTIDCGGFF